MNDLIDQLEQLVDSGSERVRAMFAELRAAVPRPMTLVFVPDECGHDNGKSCDTPCGKYAMRKFGDVWCGGIGNHYFPRTKTPEGMIDAMQQHFNAAWSAMTEVTQ